MVSVYLDDDRNAKTTTKINWYPFKRQVAGRPTPKRVGIVKYPRPPC